MWIQSLGREDPLELQMATHSNILAWEIPWSEELWRAAVHRIAKSQSERKHAHARAHTHTHTHTHTHARARAHTPESSSILHPLPSLHLSPTTILLNMLQKMRK